MAQKQTETEKADETAIVTYKGMPLTITFNDIIKYICPLASPQEVGIFLKTCQSLNLNPFASEVYLVKYSATDRASTIISIDSYLKAAEANQNYDGHSAGIILKDTPGKLEFREGAFLLDEERGNLVGGWARVYRKDRSHPYYVSVHKSECIKHRKDGSVTEFWQESKQPWMLRKVALSRALVEAFSSLFAGLVSNVEYEELPKEVITKLPQPRGESEEGELPIAFIKDGQADWSKFWAHQAERGIDGKRAHQLLKVESIKAELFERGETLEGIDQMITEALKQEEILGAAAPSPLKGEEKPVGVPTPLPEPASPAKLEKPREAVSPPQKPKRDPSTIKSIDDLKQACHELGLTDQDILKEANAPSFMYIVNPKQVYQAILAVRGVA